MDTQKSTAGIITLGIFVFLGLIFALGSFTVIGAGERGVIVTAGAVQDRILNEGVHFKKPFVDDIQKINIKTQTVRFEQYTDSGDEVNRNLMAASKDLQDVTISAVVNFHQDAEKVNKVYQQYGSTYEQNVIEPIIKETVKSVAAGFTAEELVTKRIEVSDKITSTLAQKFSEKDATLERFSITNFQFSNSFNTAIEAKVTAEQNALGAKNKLEQVKYEAEQRIVQSKAEAEAIRIQAQAITQQGGESYVQLQAIKQWNGILPTQMFGNSTPFINVR